jgi:hypothetical protein
VTFAFASQLPVDHAPRGVGALQTVKKRAPCGAFTIREPFPPKLERHQLIGLNPNGS